MHIKGGCILIRITGPYKLGAGADCMRHVGPTTYFFVLAKNLFINFLEGTLGLLSWFDADNGAHPASMPFILLALLKVTKPIGNAYLWSNDAEGPK